MLRGEWTNQPQAQKTHLDVTLKTAATKLSHTPAHHLCQHVIDLVKNPWEHPTLTKIIQDNADVSDAEGKIRIFIVRSIRFILMQIRLGFAKIALEFCLGEKPVLLNIRLEMLCESRCEDLALKLVTVCRKCIHDPADSRFADLCPPSQQEQWLDLHVALLYRFKKKKEEFIPLLNNLSLEDGYQLVKRFVDRGTTSDSQTPTGSGGVGGGGNRIWRYSLKIAELASQCLLTAALIRCPPPTFLSSLAVQLVQLQKTMGKSSQSVVDMFHTLVDHNKLITSAHMYMLCDALSEVIRKDFLLKCLFNGRNFDVIVVVVVQFRGDLQSLCIELYVRAVAVDLNDLEQRNLNPAEKNGVKTAEIGLAAAFSSLTELVGGNGRICRECALTAFSLHPTQERFDKLVQLAGQTVHDPTQVGVIKSDAISVVGEPPPGCPGGSGATAADGSSPDGLDTFVKEASEDADSGVDLSDIVVAPSGSGGLDQQDVMAGGSAATARLEEDEMSPYSSSAAASLGVSVAVINDLANVVHSWRWQVLTWKSGWHKLEPLCRRYLDDQENMRAVTKELLYLNPDYSQFKDMPRPERDEFWGIEKGYENCLELPPLMAVDPVTSASAAAAERKTRAKSAKSAKSVKRLKSKQHTLKSSAGSRLPTSGSSSPHPDVDSVASVERKRVLRKKWMRKATQSLKTSSDSDSGSVGFTTPSEIETATPPPPSLPPLPDGVKRSARIKAAKV